jgi:hypothetical protein
VDKGDEVMLDSPGGVDGPNDPSGEMPGSGGINKDKLVMIPPIQGVLDGYVSHTTLYYGHTVSTRKSSANPLGPDPLKVWGTQG